MGNTKKQYGTEVARKTWGRKAGALNWASDHHEGRGRETGIQELPWKSIREGRREMICTSTGMAMARGEGEGGRGNRRRKKGGGTVGEGVIEDRSTGMTLDTRREGRMENTSTGVARGNGEWKI
jgi:hypothetical protein